MNYTHISNEISLIVNLVLILYVNIFMYMYYVYMLVLLCYHHLIYSENESLQQYKTRRLKGFISSYSPYISNVIIHTLLIHTKCIVMMKKNDLSFPLILIISIISGLRIRINNLRKGGKELVDIYICNSSHVISTRCVH